MHKEYLQWGVRSPTLLLLAVAGVALGAALQEKPRRAKPPTFGERTRRVFFDDARERLVGERPAGVTTAASSGAHAGEPRDDAGLFRWSQVVTGEVLATEIKRTVNGLNAPLTSVGRFRSGGYLECRRDFALLAVLFGVAAEYDGDVRWASDAPALRDSLARLSLACETASDQSFTAAARKKSELDDLLRGQRLVDSAEASKTTGDWRQVAELSLLMNRMETALSDRIADALSSQRSLQRADDEVRQEAGMIDLLAVVASRPEYDSWDDETYVQYIEDLRRAAQQLAVAAAEGDLERARSAAARANQACAECHEGYR